MRERVATSSMMVLIKYYLHDGYVQFELKDFPTFHTVFPTRVANTAVAQHKKATVAIQQLFVRTGLERDKSTLEAISKEALAVFPKYYYFMYMLLEIVKTSFGCKVSAARWFFARSCESKYCTEDRFVEVQLDYIQDLVEKMIFIKELSEKYL